MRGKRPRVPSHLVHWWKVKGQACLPPVKGEVNLWRFMYLPICWDPDSEVVLADLVDIWKAESHLKQDFPSKETHFKFLICCES
jgi:hypothetical protein